MSGFIYGVMYRMYMLPSHSHWWVCNISTPLCIPSALHDPQQWAHPAGMQARVCTYLGRASQGWLLYLAVLPAVTDTPAVADTKSRTHGCDSWILCHVLSVCKVVSRPRTAMIAGDALFLSQVALHLHPLQSL